MRLRAKSSQDQITRTKLDAKERDALRRQLHGTLEPVLPDLSDSKVHEVLAGYAAADGPPIARVPPASTVNDGASEHPVSESTSPRATTRQRAAITLPSMTQWRSERMAGRTENDSSSFSTSLQLSSLSSSALSSSSSGLSVSAPYHSSYPRHLLQST